MESGKRAKWIAMATAAADFDVPLRTLYNWQRTGRLKSKTEDGATVIDPEGLAALVSQRNGANSAGTGAASGNGMATGKGQAARITGPDAAKGFKALQDGTEPVNLVAELGMAPETAIAVVEHFDKLSLAGSKPGSKAADRLAQVEQRLQFLTEDVGAATNNFTLAQQVAELAAELRDVRAGLEQVGAWTRSVLAPPSTVRCSCGSAGRVRVAMQCLDCSSHLLWPGDSQHR